MKKILSFISILMVILGVITLVTGIMDVGLLLGSDGGAVAEALAVLAVVGFVAGGLLDVIGGLLGLRAAKDPARSMGAIVFGLLALIAAVVSAVMAVSAATICACIIPLVYFICALAVRSRG